MKPILTLKENVTWNGKGQTLAFALRMCFIINLRDWDVSWPLLLK